MRNRPAPAGAGQVLDLTHHAELIRAQVALQHEHVIAHSILTLPPVPARASGARVMLVDDLAKPPPGHVRVDLRGGNVGVPQHDLHAAQVRAALHQVRGETVPDHVRRQAAENPDLAGRSP